MPETLSRAVLRSLEGDASARYSSARELSRALEAGLAGHEPPAALRRAADGHARRQRRHRRDAPDGRPTRRPRSRPSRCSPPRGRPPGAAPGAAGSAPGRPRAAQALRRLSRFFRAIGVLLLIAVLAAIIAGAVLLLTDAGQDTDIGQTIKDNLNDQIQAIEDFVRENTQ